MRKILLSLFTIAIVGALIGGGVTAFFSDVEESLGTFTAGTIDIAIDGENPWEATFAIEQAKPSQVWYQEFEITNVGNNPCVVYKHLKDFVAGGGIMAYPDPVTGPASSEPEYQAGLNNGELPYVEKCNIQKWILYDLYSEITYPLVGGGTDQWHQTEFDENVSLADVRSVNVPLGSIPVDGKMKVIESYHLDYDTPNDYQGDTLSFTIEFYAVQLEGTTVLLENKADALYAGGPAKVAFDDDGDNVFLDEDQDDTWGKLDYNTVGASFGYTFEASGLDATTDYGLIYYADPWNVQNPTTLIARFTTDGSGDIASTTGSIDLNMDLPALTDANALLGAKIWLVECADLDNPSAVPGALVKYQNWGNLENNLTETHLIWYNDTDVP
jgi:predicted ribosomally synthesized peptide with SipW-like signal peptide